MRWYFSTLFATLTVAPAFADDVFEKQIRPLLMEHCIQCHGPKKASGGLRLSTRESFLKGGDRGPAIVLGKPSESLLMNAVNHVGAVKMPPKGKLTDQQIAHLSQWIARGAEWKGGSIQLPMTADSANGEWAFRPIQRSAMPVLSADRQSWVRNPIDAFIAAKLQMHGLSPLPEAGQRILARRVYIDLTGLPPTPTELEGFLRDPDPNSYEQLVDRLLASPRYGERWARHWLDVAHYADSHGQDQDRFRPNAWPYRDYLIRAFNADKPYARFVREQIAGDVLFTDDPDGVVATGFLAAGPWDESGLRDINENSIDRQIARYLDRDDIVTSVMTTFTGLTVHCARCHDHKFDPITQADYYSLQAVFAGIDKAERAYDPEPTVAKKRADLQAELTRVRNLRGKLDPAFLTAERRAEIAAFEKVRIAAEGRWFVPEPESAKAKHGTILKVQTDRSILATGPNPERDSYTVSMSTDRTAITGFRVEVLCDDSLPHKGPGRQPNGNLHLSEVRVQIYPKGKPELAIAVKIKSAVADFDQIDWGVHRAIDGNPGTAWGIYPQVGKPHQAVFEFEKPVGFESGTTFVAELDQLHGGSHLIGRVCIALTTDATPRRIARPLPQYIAAILGTDAAKRSEAQVLELASWIGEQRIEQELSKLPTQGRVYCGTNRFTAEGSFRPATVPRTVHILGRGEISKPGTEAKPGTVKAVMGPQERFALRDLNDEGARRAALANWLTDSANPLTWRVIVNRVWHYHFGKGIVHTPNDFGKMGGAPSHPELLDWLAAEFRDRGGSLKSLHKLILMSNTYRQAIRHDAEAALKDADNRLFWRMNRGRLDAEGVRDAILQASGRLDGTMYGPPVKHFIMKPGIHVTPEADYDRFDVDALDARRRSVYRYIFRTRPDPMLEALDCPDASQSAPVRGSTVSAPQALVLWNNKFLLRHSEHLATLAAKESSELSAQMRFVSERLLCREPTTDEMSRWTIYARKHGLANLCRVLLNSSEFLFVD